MGKGKEIWRTGGKGVYKRERWGRVGKVGKGRARRGDVGKDARRWGKVRKLEKVWGKVGKGERGG